MERKQGRDCPSKTQYEEQERETSPSPTPEQQIPGEGSGGNPPAFPQLHRERQQLCQDRADISPQGRVSLGIGREATGQHPLEPQLHSVPEAKY